MNPKSQIQSNARAITELHRHVHETARERDQGSAQRELWRAAWADFHAQYETLAFTGGISTARDRMRAGDDTAIEYALCFIEIRPYFFRSGYMYNDLLRVLRNCELTLRQRERYNRVYDMYRAYRRARQLARDSG